MCTIMLTQGALHDMSNNRIGDRIRLLRETQGLQQARMAEILGLCDRQSVSQIERGNRRVSAEELVRIIDHFGVTLDWLTNPFLLTAKESFSWRQRDVSVADLDAFEALVGEWIGAYRELNRLNDTPLKQLMPRLSLTYSSSLDEAVSSGESVSTELELGDRPAHKLAHALESRLGILVLMVDALKGISGAACGLQDLNAILINRHERPARRNTDLAHEFFHILTWKDMRPARVESSVPSWEEPHTHTDRRNQKIERLADNFAAGLLMPTLALDLLGEPHGDLTAWLIAGADLLGVSSRTLKWRLVNSKRAPQIERVSNEALSAALRPQGNPELPPLFSKPFIATIGRAIDSGHLSIGRAAKLLHLPKDELGKLFDSQAVERPAEL